jgi:endonuclease G
MASKYPLKQKTGKQNNTLKKPILVVLFLFLFCTSQPILQPDFSSTRTNEHLQYGLPSLDGQLIIREGYTLLHDGNKKVPLWVSYHLTKEDLQGTAGRTDDFRPDPEIPVGHRAELSDYKGSGYDRGHMAPAGDMNRSKKVMSESFYLSNMCPQEPTLNRNKWRILEEKARNFTLAKGESWIITGPVFMDIDGDGNKDCLGRIGTNRVWVPTHFYKIIVTQNGEIKAISFLMPNRNPERDIGNYQVPVDSIEKITGLDFLNELPDDIENVIEAQKPSHSLQR